MGPSSAKIVVWHLVRPFVRLACVDHRLRYKNPILLALSCGISIFFLRVLVKLSSFHVWASAIRISKLSSPPAMWGLVVLCWQGHNILLTIAAYCHKCNAFFIPCHWPIVYNMSLKLSVKQTVQVRGMFIGILCFVCRTACDKAVCNRKVLRPAIRTQRKTALWMTEGKTDPSSCHQASAEIGSHGSELPRRANHAAHHFDLSKLIPLHQGKW